MTKGTTPSCHRFHRHGACDTTMSWVESDPAASTAPATARLIAASYETICADARTEPSSGYFEPDDQPASMIPYTAIDDMASTSRMPIGGSASCRYVSWPKIVTTPCWSSVNVPPIGITEKVISAGRSDREGASLKTMRSA